MGCRSCQGCSWVSQGTEGGYGLGIHPRAWLEELGSLQGCDQSARLSHRPWLFPFWRKCSRHSNISKPNKTPWRILLLWPHHLPQAGFENIKQGSERGCSARKRTGRKTGQQRPSPPRAEPLCWDSAAAFKNCRLKNTGWSSLHNPGRAVISHPSSML